MENPISTLLNAQKRFQEFVAKLQARGICTLAKIEHVCFLEGGSNYEELWESSLPPRRCHWSPSTFKVRGKHSFFMELTLFVINNLFHRFPHDFLRIAHCPCSHILICIVDRNLRSLQASSMAQTFWASLLEEGRCFGVHPLSFHIWTLAPFRKKKHKSLVKTAVRYQDGSGKNRYKGAGAALKGTQFLVHTH